MNFPIFTEMFTAVDGALAAIIARYVSIVALVTPALVAGVTIYIILLGGAILRGAVSFPFREFVYRGLKLAAVLYAVSTLYGAQIGLFTMNGLPGDFATALGGADVGGLGGYFDRMLQGAFKAITIIEEIVARQTQAAGTTLGIPNNLHKIIAAALLCLAILIIALLSTALGFTICAFALFALALLAVVGPLFVAALLFDSTRAYFFSWLGSTISQIILVAFALLVTLFISQTTNTFINAITLNDDVMVAAVKAIAFYVLGFFFFLQIPGLAAGLGGGGASMAGQFASAVVGGPIRSSGKALAAINKSAVNRGRGSGGGSMTNTSPGR